MLTRPVTAMNRACAGTRKSGQNRSFIHDFTAFI